MPPRIRTTINSSPISSKTLHTTSALAYLLVGLWLILVQEGQTRITVCPSKLIYHLPCPGCGVTRATLLFLQGHWADALMLNPNCLLAIFFLLCYPLAVVLSLMRGRSYIAVGYRLMEAGLRRKAILVPFLLIEAAIWVHNVVAGV